jgi:hypothetical protein
VLLLLRWYDSLPFIRLPHFLTQQNRLKANQKEAVQMFMAVTDARYWSSFVFLVFIRLHCSENRAIEYLTKYNWNNERACDEYFMNPPPPEHQAVKRVDKNALLNLFLKYAEKGVS